MKPSFKARFRWFICSPCYPQGWWCNSQRPVQKQITGQLVQKSLRISRQWQGSVKARVGPSGRRTCVTHWWGAPRQPRHCSRPSLHLPPPLPHTHTHGHTLSLCAFWCLVKSVPASSTGGLTRMQVLGGKGQNHSLWSFARGAPSGWTDSLQRQRTG